VHPCTLVHTVSVPHTHLHPTAKKGLPPGAIVHVGRRKRETMTATVIDYDGTHIDEHVLKSLAEAVKYTSADTVSWINVVGLHDTDSIEKLGATFGLHPLLLEDIVNTTQRPKVEEYQDCLFIIIRLLNFDDTTQKLVSEQVSLVIGKGYVISFQEDDKDVFDPVRDLLRKGKGKIRSEGADFLLYRLLDVLVDSYFDILERVGAAIETLEEELLKQPSPQILNHIHLLRRDMIFARKAVWPLREVISTLERIETPLVDHGTLVYLRDVYDHTVQVMDAVETYRDMLATMFDQYLSAVSNRMNEVMKVLTVIATIFMPLTFIAGIYGMNFRMMPELSWPYGYPVVLGVCLFIAIVMVIAFKRKRWL